MKKLVPVLLILNFGILFGIDLHAQGRQEEEEASIGFGIGMIASIAEEDDWGINSRFFWKITPRGTVEFEANNYFDRQDLKSMMEYSLNYQREILSKKRFVLYIMLGYLGNNYDWDRDACSSCWAVQKGAWNHGINGGLGFSLKVGPRSDLFFELRSKSIGSRYAIGILGLNYYLLSAG
ncbi:MAG: hypothetical protein R8P61_31840 [Bacteroidia bacterium]|nr:hypothetical protein [Bacteroidia bacterium]